MMPIPFQWLEFAFECFESLSNGSNLILNATNPSRMVGIWIRMFRIPFESFEFAFEMLLIPFELFEFDFECCESFRMVTICLRTL